MAELDTVTTGAPDTAAEEPMSVTSSTKHADVILDSDPSEDKGTAVTEEAPKKKKVVKKKKTEDGEEGVTKKKVVKKKKIGEDGEVIKTTKKKKEKDGEEGVTKKKSVKKKSEKKETEVAEAEKTLSTATEPLDKSPDTMATEIVSADKPGQSGVAAAVDSRETSMKVAAEPEPCEAQKAGLAAGAPETAAVSGTAVNASGTAVAGAVAVSDAPSPLPGTAPGTLSEPEPGQPAPPTDLTGLHAGDLADVITEDVLGFHMGSEAVAMATDPGALSSQEPAAAASASSPPAPGPGPGRSITESVESFLRSEEQAAGPDAGPDTRAGDMEDKSDFEKEMDAVRQKADDLVSKILQQTRADKHKVDMGGGGAAPPGGHAQDDYRTLTSAFEQDVSYDFRSKARTAGGSDLDADVGRSLLERRLDSMRLTEERHLATGGRDEQVPAYRSRNRKYDDQMADEYGDLYRPGSGFGTGPPRRGPRSVISEDDFETGSLFSSRRRLARQDYLDDSSEEEIVFEEADFVPEKSDTTDELVKEKSRDARSVVDHQAEVVDKLRRASESFDETLNEIKALRESFLETQYRRNAVLEDLEVDKIKERYMDEWDDGRPHYGRHGNRGLGYTPYSNQRPLKLDKELEDDAPILRGKALSSLATTFGSGRAGDPYEQEYEPENKPGRRQRYDAWDEEYEPDSKPRGRAGFSLDGFDTEHPRDRDLHRDHDLHRDRERRLPHDDESDYDLEYKPYSRRGPSLLRQQEVGEDAGYEEDLESVSMVGAPPEERYSARGARWERGGAAASNPFSFYRDREGSEVKAASFDHVPSRAADKYSASSGYSSGSAYSSYSAASARHAGLSRVSSAPDYSSYGGALDGEALMGRATYHQTTGSGSRFLQKVRDKAALRGDDASSGKRDKPFRSRFLKGSAADIDVSKYSVSNYFTSSVTSSSAVTSSSTAAAEETTTNGDVHSDVTGAGHAETAAEAAPAE